MPKAKENSSFTNVLEGDILKDEVASKRFGYYSLLWFCGIILISSSISLSHYIKRDLSSKILRLNRLRFVWRVLLPLESSTLVLQTTWCIFFIKRIWSKCVCWSKGPLKGDLATSRILVVLSTFYLILYNDMFLSHKTSLVLLYDSLITYIGSCWVYYIAFTLVGLCYLAGSILLEHWNRSRMVIERGNDI